MEYHKKINVIDNTPIQPSKFRTNVERITLLPRLN